jgi:hypothetical protein
MGDDVETHPRAVLPWLQAETARVGVEVTKPLPDTADLLVLEAA